MFTVEYIKSLDNKNSALKRLFKGIDKASNSCWYFSGSKDRCGYGRFRIGKHYLGAHKISYLLMVGDYDQSSMEIMHSCDNPACINPSHLSAATHKDNIKDCLKKGRHTSQRLNGCLVYLSSRMMAIQDSKKVYVGSDCKIHRIGFRKTNNGACIYCQAEYAINKRINRAKG